MSRDVFVDVNPACFRYKKMKFEKNYALCDVMKSTASNRFSTKCPILITKIKAEYIV